jgi:hypothetical protein
MERARSILSRMLLPRCRRREIDGGGARAAINLFGARADYQRVRRSSAVVLAESVCGLRKLNAMIAECAFLVRANSQRLVKQAG